MITREIGIKRTVKTRPFKNHKGTERIGDICDLYILGATDMRIGAHEPFRIGRDMSHPLGDDRPRVINALVHGPGNLVFLGISCHLELSHKRENSLRRQQVTQALGQPFLGR